MQDIEDLLNKNDMRPARPLHKDFTSQTLNAIASQAAKPSWLAQWKETISMKIIHKPIIAILALTATILMGGAGVYAAANGWSSVTALFGGEKKLDQGARIVAVDVQNCFDVNAFNITTRDRPGDAPKYFKLKATSRLSNDDVVRMVKATCEADYDAKANDTPVVHDAYNLAQNQHLVAYFGDSIITALTDSSISIRTLNTTMKANGTTDSRPLDQTFTQIDPDVIVINEGARVPFNSLKVGDHISISYRATGRALTDSETLAPDQLDTSAQTVAIIFKVSKNMVDYYNYQKYRDTDFEQVVPCDKTAIGYCTVEEYQQK
jgi:hypothetical protein